MAKKKRRRPPPRPLASETVDEEAEPEPSRTDGDTFPRPVTFLTNLRYAWRAYRARWHALVGLFIAFYVAFAAITFGLLVSPLDPVFGLLAQTILGAALGSVAVAISAPLIADHFAGVQSPLSEGFAAFRKHRRDIIALALLAGLLSTFLIQIGGLIGYFISFAVVGPPILAQLVTIEDSYLSEAWARARPLMKFEWGRLFMYLVNVSLTIGFVTFFAISYLSYGTSDANDVLQVAIVFLLDAILLGIMVPFLGAMQVVAYLDVRARKEELDEAGWIKERARPTPSTQD